MPGGSPSSINKVRNSEWQRDFSGVVAIKSLEDDMDVQMYFSYSLTQGELL